jgi:NADPH:quinone reductase-like Zn-dependent oxidoreductase
MPRIVRFREKGSADVLKLEDLPLEEPSGREVRLKVEAIGLNRAEVMYRQGQYLETPKLPSRIGYEAAGTIDALGPGVDGFEIGDRVSTIPSFSMQKYGVYGESAVVPAVSVAHYPAMLSAVEGAAIWMQYLTAYGALIHYGQLKSGEFVVIPAASSSVGLAAIQITKAVGAVAIVTTRGADKKPFLVEAGADHVIVTNDEDLVERVNAITAGKGARIIFDPVAGPFVETLAEAAASRAMIIEYGALSLKPTPFPLFTALAKGLTVRGYTLFEIVSDPETFERGKRYVYDGLASGALKPLIDRTFPLKAIADAHRYMESNQQKGKIVVTV